MLATRMRLAAAGGAVAGPEGWWTDYADDLVGAWDALVADSYSASKTDLSGNGHTLWERNGAVTWDSTNGWQFTASEAKAFSTLVTPSSSATTMMVQFTNVSTALACIMGAFAALDGSADFAILPYGNGGTQVRYRHGSNDRYVSPQLASGVLAISQWQAYRNGSADGSPITSSSPTYLYPMALGAGVRRHSETYDWYITGNIQRAAIWDAAKDSSMIAAIYADWTA